jgi:hypothetical protein
MTEWQKRSVIERINIEFERIEYLIEEVEDFAPQWFVDEMDSVLSWLNRIEQELLK